MIILFWIGFAVVVGVGANTRGRNGPGWGVLALAISPLLAGLLLLALPRGTARVQQDYRWSTLRSTPMPTPETKMSAKSFYIFMAVWAVSLLIVGNAIITGVK
jgi:steroid 5-alpha reductase family enzyme